jgi:hypothetical protein
MTYFLIKELNDHPQLTLPQAYESVREAVPQYIAQQFPGEAQTPLLYDNTTPPVYLRP